MPESVTPNYLNNNILQKTDALQWGIIFYRTLIARYLGATIKQKNATNLATFFWYDLNLLLVLLCVLSDELCIVEIIDLHCLANICESLGSFCAGNL